MFKEQYKKANDSISINEELLDSLLKEAEKPKGVVKFKNIYKYSAAVAAVLVLIIAVVTIPKFSIEDKKTQTKKAPTLSYQTPKPTTIPTQSPTPTTASIKKGKDSASNQKIQQADIYADVSSSYAAAMTNSQDTLDPLSINGTEKARILEENINSQPSHISVDEFCEFFRFEISQINLPKGLALITKVLDITFDQDGNPIFTETTISYLGDYKALNLTLCQDSDIILAKVSENPHEKLEGVSIVENEEETTIYIKNAYNSYIASCIGFSPEEVEALAISLKL